jgi:ceramide synthetase
MSSANIVCVLTLCSPLLSPLRFHNIGLLVLFLHDINDIQLEFTKLNVYFKTRGGGYYLINDILSNMGSVSFSITW